MRIVTADQAVSSIKSGDHVYVHAAAAAPAELLDALVGRADELADVNVVHFHIEGPGPHLQPEMAGHFFHRALFIGPNARSAVNEGRAEYIPVFLSDAAALIRRGTIPVDTALINVSQPDAHGYCSMGTSVIALHTAIHRANTVVAQINRSMPRTLGDGFIHVDDIDLGVEVDIPPYTHALAPIGELERNIGGYIADLVPHEATIQMGIGAIPSAV